MERIKINHVQNDKSVGECIDLFLRKCKIKNLSEKTIKFYECKLNLFTKFYNEADSISEITIATVDDFIVYLRENTDENDITINTTIRTMRAFLYYCMECDYLKPFKIKLCKVEKKIKETYTDEELKRLLVKPNLKSCKFSEYRAWVFINYLLGTGNRISTAINLQVKDINFDSGMITLCKTKNRKQQLIPLSKNLAQILEEYITLVNCKDTDYVFCNDFGTKGSIRSYQTLITRYNIKRNVNKTSCHLFRHTFAKNYILSGGDVFRLQKILGHSDISVTKEYVNLWGQDLQVDFDKFDILQRLNTNNMKVKIN